MKEETLAKMFLNRAREFAHKDRFVEKKGGRWVSMTYSELRDRVENIACGLLSIGVEKGDKISILGGVRGEWFQCDWAAICLGVVTVPIYPSNTAEQVAYIIDDCDAKAIFLENTAQLDKVLSRIQRLGKLEKIIIWEEPPPGNNIPDLMTFQELIIAGREYSKKHPDAFMEHVNSIRPEDILTIIYTSGTTGPPKGVVTDNSNYAFMVKVIGPAIDMKPEDVNLHFLPLAHSFGRLEHFATYGNGVTTWIAQSLDTIIDDLRDAKPTILISVPRIYEKAYTRINQMAEEGGRLKKAIFDWSVRTGRQLSKLKQKKAPIPLWLRIKYFLANQLIFKKVKRLMGGRLRFAISGAAPISVEILEFFHACGILILEGWGMTETSTAGTVNRHNDYKFGTIGKPLPGVEMKVAEDGEILLRGPNRFQYYYKNPEATAEAIDADGWLHTGDVGIVDEDGFFRITDRKKDIIVTAGGKNIAPQNIENLLKTSPYISQAMVYGDKRKYLTALITLDREEVLKYADAKEIEYGDFAELAKKKEIVDLIKRVIEERNAQLASYETIKDFKILERDFSIENNELTPTLKVKRKEVIKKYKDILDGMYKEIFD